MSDELTACADCGLYVKVLPDKYLVGGVYPHSGHFCNATGDLSLFNWDAIRGKWVQRVEAHYPWCDKINYDGHCPHFEARLEARNV